MLLRRDMKYGLMLGALCVCVLAAVSFHPFAHKTELDAPYGGYWGGYYDSGYYGAYNNPYAYDVARQDYWSAMNAFDAQGVWSYNEWVEQRRDWDRSGYGYGPYDSKVNAEYYRSADQNGWADQTRYNSYLSAYNAEAGGEYPYGYPSIADNHEFQSGYPSIASNFEQRGGLYRRAADLEDSNHPGSYWGELDGELLGRGGRTLRDKYTWPDGGVDGVRHWPSSVANNFNAQEDGKRVLSGNGASAVATKAPRTSMLAQKPQAQPMSLPDAKEAYARAAATFRHAYPRATYREWLEASSKWDQFFVTDRLLDTQQVLSLLALLVQKNNDERKVAYADVCRCSSLTYAVC
jgi:hypothetical protein